MAQKFRTKDGRIFVASQGRIYNETCTASVTLEQFMAGVDPKPKPRPQSPQPPPQPTRPIAAQTTIRTMAQAKQAVLRIGTAGVPPVPDTLTEALTWRREHWGY
jgi:hypothetical protein